MTFDEYQTFCTTVRLSTASPLYCLHNLAGEVGELFSLIAKAERDGEQPSHLDNVKKELGDILWSVAMIAEDYGMDLSYVAEGNVDKLSKRKQNKTIQGSGDER